MIMLEDVTLRLKNLGYTTTDEDVWILQFIINKVEKDLIAECGVYDAASEKLVIPDGLYYVAVDKVTGEFMSEKKSIGGLTDFNISAAVKSVQEGDTTVTFAVGSGDKTPEQRLDDLITYLKTNGDRSIASYRVFQW
jgi:hypothetical protein